MKNKILDGIITNIKKYYNYNDTKLLEIRYGLETLYLTLFKLIIVLIISIFIHTSKELCLLFLIYGILRLTGFGLHTKNSIECWILSIGTFSLIPYLIKYLIINPIYMYYTFPIIILLIILYAPADTEKRPLINKHKRLIFKILTIITTIIYLIIIMFTNSIYIKKLFYFSIVLEILLINPLSYKLLGLKYNNYKLYKKKGGK